jgi:hypothetical protein
MGQTALCAVVQYLEVLFFQELFYKIIKIIYQNKGKFSPDKIFIMMIRCSLMQNFVIAKYNIKRYQNRM